MTCMNLRFQALIGTLACIAIGWLEPAVAQQSFPVHGKGIHKGEKFEPMGKDEKSGRIVFYSQSRVTDRELQGNGVFNAGVRIPQAHWDLTNGYGTGRGFSRVEKAGGSVLLEWTGVCYTVNGADGKNIPHCSGGWFVVPGSGTGPYAGLDGGGTWTGSVTADGGFDEDWIGMIRQ